MADYFTRPREDGKVDILEGTELEPGRIVTTLDTPEAADQYITDLNAETDDLINELWDSLDEPVDALEAAMDEEDTVPYKLANKDGKTCVVKKSDGSVVKCHDDREKAVAHLKALYVNQADASVQAAIDELEDEPVEEVIAAYNTGEHGITAPADNTITVNGNTVINNGFSTSANSTLTVVSHAEMAGPPSAFFTNPELTELQRWTTITDDGRVFGHSAGKGECHIGYQDRCITIDDIADGIVAGCNWEYSMPGHVVTAEGTKIGTGPLPIKGGHADKSLDWIGAVAHYDDPATVVADVVYGRDEFGIWFSGAIRPTATPEMIYALRASGVSLDARGIGSHLRYLITCCVNSAGFPKADARIAASGEIMALVAAGGQPLPHPDLCDCKDMTADIIEELDSLQRIVADAGLEDMVIEKLASRVLSDDELDTLYERITSDAS